MASSKNLKITAGNNMNSQYYDVSSPPLTFSCTSVRCNAEDNEFMLTCAKCKRPTHFLCTRLPAYQLFIFTKKEVKKVMGKKQRRYVCHTCCGEVPRAFFDNSIEAGNHDEGKDITSTIRQPHESYKDAFERLQKQYIEHECKYKELLGSNQEKITNLTRTKKYLTDSLWKLCLERNEVATDTNPGKVAAWSQTDAEQKQSKTYVSVLAHTKIKSQSFDVLKEEEEVTPSEELVGEEAEALQTGNITRVKSGEESGDDTTWQKIMTLEAHQGLLKKHIKALKLAMGITENDQHKRWSSPAAPPSTPSGVLGNQHINVYLSKNDNMPPPRAKSAEPPCSEEKGAKDPLTSLNEKLLKRLSPPIETFCTASAEETPADGELKEAPILESPCSDVSIISKDGEVIYTHPPVTPRDDRIIGVERYPLIIPKRCSESADSIYTPEPSPRSNLREPMKPMKANLVGTPSKSEVLIPTVPTTSSPYVPYLNTKTISRNIDQLSSNTREFLASKRWSSSSMPNYSMEELSIRAVNSFRTYSPSIAPCHHSTYMPPCHLGENKGIVQLQHRTAHLKSTINDLSARLQSYNTELAGSRSSSRTSLTMSSRRNSLTMS